MAKIERKARDRPMLAAPDRSATGLRAGAPAGVKAEAIRLAPHVTGRCAAAAIIRACLAHFESNQAGVIGGCAEAVHQARVALRRLRSALALFRDNMPSDAKTLDTWLRRLSRSLGALRDWDVFMTETLPRFTESRPGPAALVAPLGAAERASTWKAATRRLRGRPHAAGLDRIRRLAGEIDRPAAPTARDSAFDGPCRALGAVLLDREAKRVRRKGRGPALRDPAARHSLRKALKRLRYAVDFLAPLYPETAVSRFLQAAEGLQHVLGRLNDSAATGAMVDALRRLNVAEPNRGDIAEALGAMASWARQDRTADKHALRRAWRDFVSAEPFWA